MRILFFMRNFSGYFRQFEPALEALLEEGHEVIVARDRKDEMRGVEWANAMQREYPRFKIERTGHPRSDPWGDLKRQIRLTLDYLQFLDASYADTTELVLRARRRAPDRVVRAMERPGTPLRRPSVVHAITRALRTIEAATPSNPAIRKLIAGIDPDVVLLTPHLMPGSHHPDYLRASMDLGLPSVLCVASWDNLSSKQIIRIRPDAVTVWNETQKREAVEIHSLDPETVHVTGAQVYDQWFDWPERPREEFCARVGLPADRPFILYAAGALFPAPITEAEWFVTWLRALRECAHPELREAAVLVRPHPKRFEQWAEIPLDQFEHVSLWPREGRMPVERDAKQDFYDSIAHSHGVVGINTSAMIEAGIVGKRVHTVLVPEFTGSQHGTLHFRYLAEVGGGLLSEATSLDEHFDQLAETFAAGGSDRGANRGFLEAFVRPQGLDRPSTPVFVETIERAAAIGKRTPPRLSPPRWALRTALKPVRIGFAVWGDRRQQRNRAAKRGGEGAPGPLMAMLASSAVMTATKPLDSRIRQAKIALRSGTDRERALYVTVRKALAPKTTLVRARAARHQQPQELELQQDRGWSILPPGRLTEADEIVTIAQERLASTDVEEISRKRKGKQFMLPIIEKDSQDRESALMRLALREDVLSTISAYLGTAPLLTNVNVYLSSSTGRDPISSQLLHCDADDTAQVKIFVLCSEVTEASGPLMIMDASASEALRKKVGYRYNGRLTDEDAIAATGDLNMQALEGPEGTVCLVDTSRCFHYGSRVKEDAPPRLAAMIQYLTPHSFMLPRNPTSSAPFKHLARPGDSELVRLALGA